MVKRNNPAKGPGSWQQNFQSPVGLLYKTHDAIRIAQYDRHDAAIHQSGCDRDRSV